MNGNDVFNYKMFSIKKFLGKRFHKRDLQEETYEFCECKHKTCICNMQIPFYSYLLLLFFMDNDEGYYYIY